MTPFLAAALQAYRAKQNVEEGWQRFDGAVKGLRQQAEELLQRIEVWALNSGDPVLAMEVGMLAGALRGLLPDSAGDATMMASGPARGIAKGLGAAKKLLAGLLGSTGKVVRGVPTNLGSHASKAPRSVSPGVRELEGHYVDDLGRVQPWRAHYDEYGRMIGRTDYNAGNRAAGIPDTHYERWEYNGKYPQGRKVENHVPGEFPQ